MTYAERRVFRTLHVLVLALIHSLQRIQRASEVIGVPQHSSWMEGKPIVRTKSCLQQGLCVAQRKLKRLTTRPTLGSAKKH